MQLFLLLFLWVRAALVGVWVAVALLVPLMIVEVVTHLPDCLGAGRLVLDWHLGKPSVCIKFHITGIEDVLVVVVYFYIFVASDALVVVTGYCATLHLA